MQVTPEDIAAIARLVHDLCGIVLDRNKGYLIASPLSGLAESRGGAPFSHL